MSTIARILVPVDLGPATSDLLRYGVAWADRFESELHILYVASTIVPRAGPASAGEATHATSDRVEEARRSLASTIAALPVASDRLRTAVRVGRPGTEIEAYAAEYGVNLIVMASGAREGPAPGTLGGVSEQVVRRALCPVITVPPEARIPPGLAGLKSMVLPVDLGETSSAVLAYGRKVGTSLGAALHVIHVIAPPSERQLTYLPLDAATAALARLTSVRVDPDADGPLDLTVRVGEPAATIREYAESVQAGLIVMPTRYRSAREYLALGSVTSNLLAHASCPVLTLNPPVCRQMSGVTDGALVAIGAGGRSGRLPRVSAGKLDDDGGSAGGRTVDDNLT
jgi:nucleotide-binding universal stress UspA family protein